jgi:hypothetical protein
LARWRRWRRWRWPIRWSGRRSTVRPGLSRTSAASGRGVIVTRIPGASHCALEGEIIGRIVREECGLPVLEIEVPSITECGESHFVHPARSPCGNSERPERMMNYAGIDAGSRAIKVVLIDADGSRMIARPGRSGDRTGQARVRAVREDTRREWSTEIRRRSGRRDRLRPQCHRRRGHDDHGNHMPRSGRASPRARRPDDHRHRRPGQQARAARRQRQGPGLRDERPLRGRHRAVSRSGRRPAGNPRRGSGRDGIASKSPAAISSHVRGS